MENNRDKKIYQALLKQNDKDLKEAKDEFEKAMVHFISRGDSIGETLYLLESLEIELLKESISEILENQGAEKMVIDPNMKLRVSLRLKLKGLFDDKAIEMIKSGSAKPIKEIRRKLKENVVMDNTKNQAL